MWPWLARAAQPGQRLGDAVGADEVRRHLGRGGRGQGDQPAARADRLEDVLDGGRAEDPDGAVGGLLDGLEQRVAGLVGEPVGVLDDEDLPALADRGQGGAADQLPDLVDADRELLGADHRHVGVRAAEHGVAGVADPAARAVGRRRLALQGGGEGDRGVGAAGPGRAGEQPGLAHAVPAGGGGQRVRDHALADERAPRRVMRRAAWASSGSTRSRTRPGDLVDRQPGVEHEVVVGVRGGHLAERLAHPQVEVHGLALDAVALLEAAEPVLGLEVEHHGQVRAQVAGGPAVEPGHLGGHQVAPGALVGQRGVDVPVGDDHLAAPQRGQHDGVDVLGLVGGVEQRLGAVGELAGGRVEHDLADLAAHLGVAGLEGQQHGVALALQPRPQRLGLRGLAGALAALEADEDAVRGPDPWVVVGSRAHGVHPRWHGRHGSGRGQDFFAVAFLVVFLAVDFFAVFLAPSSWRAPSWRPAWRSSCRRALGAALGQQLGGPLEGHRLDRVVLAEGGVELAVGDVLAEATGLDHDRLPGDRVVAELLERRRRGGPATLLGLRVDLQRLLERDREQLVLGVDGPAVGALLEVGPVAAVLGGDLDALGVLADHPRQRQQLDGVLERHRVQRHRLEQRAGARARGLGGVLGQHLGHVGTEAAVLGDHRQARCPGARRGRSPRRRGSRAAPWPWPGSARRAAGPRGRWPAWPRPRRRRRGPRGRGRTCRRAARSRSRRRRSGRWPAPWRRCRRGR